MTHIPLISCNQLVIAAQASLVATGSPGFFLNQIVDSRYCFQSNQTLDVVDSCPKTRSGVAKEQHLRTVHHWRQFRIVLRQIYLNITVLWMNFKKPLSRYAHHHFTYLVRSIICICFLEMNVQQYVVQQIAIIKLLISRSN